MKKKNWRIFYPLLLGTYAAVELVSVNISQMFFSAGMRSIIFGLIFSLLIYNLFAWRIKDEYRAALLCSWFLLFFFAYGHVYGTLEGVKIFGVDVGRHRFVFPLWLAVFGAGGWLIYKQTQALHPFNRILNIISIILLVIPIIQIGGFEWRRYHPISGTGGMAETSLSPGPQSLKENQLPNIYYIILDGYPRQDMLLKYENYDNSDFIKQLEMLGFYIPTCSQSNYAMTNLSLASSLNMNYLEGLNPRIRTIDLTDSIIHSETRQFLKRWGYITVSFESGIWFTEFHDAEYYITKNKPVVSSFFDITHLSEFEVLFIRTTVLRLVEESKAAWLDNLLQNPRKEAYERILFDFDQLDLTPAIKGPKFVFVHILSFHETPFPPMPIVNGAIVQSSSVNQGLLNELQFLNNRTVEVVRTIINQSKNPPIIIIQGDHGLDTEARMANLMAYYFPNDGDKVLYPTITPVNTFRLVFNTYFGQKYPLLPDISYYSPYDDMFKFTIAKYPCSR
jgi:hypothetical protein